MAAFIQVSTENGEKKLKRVSNRFGGEQGTKRAYGSAIVQEHDSRHKRLAELEIQEQLAEIEQQLAKLDVRLSVR